MNLNSVFLNGTVINNLDNFIYICDENNIVAIDYKNKKIITESIILNYKDNLDLVKILKSYINNYKEDLKRKYHDLDQQDIVSYKKQKIE